MIFTELDTNKCSHCGKGFKHSKIYKSTANEELKEVEILVYCCSCRVLFKRQKELKHDLLQTEWKLYERKMKMIDLSA